VKHRSTGSGRALDSHLAGAPISWGACEVPGWGPMPDVERVLAEMSQLGLHGTELGAIGFLPREPAALAALLGRHRLELVGGFVPLVLHEPRADEAIELARQAAQLFAAAGANTLVLALVQDMRWSAPAALDDDGWRQLAEHVDQVQTLAAADGIGVALHPHAGTLIETAEQVERALAELDVGWCLDTGHLLIGGFDPVEFARVYGDRVVHVHLKDVDGVLAARTRSGESSLLDATRLGLFRPLGQGDARIAEVLHCLDAHAYDGWLVLEHDTAPAGDQPTSGADSTRDARASIEFIRDTVARAPAVEVQHTT
jgi:inosose dehydratase